MGKSNLTIDGTTNVDTGSNGTQHIALSLDNISEFKLLTSNYQAEYGRSGGGAIQIVTKSGTSQFHGTGYYFHRHEQSTAQRMPAAAGRRADRSRPRRWTVVGAAEHPHRRRRRPGAGKLTPDPSIGPRPR